RGGQGPECDDVRDREPAARLQHAERLREHRALVGTQVDHAVRQDDVDGTVRDRQVLDLAEPELDVAGADLARVRARLRHHLGRHVDADDAPGRPDLPGGEEAVDAAAGAEVEHGLARPQGRDRLRVAATEAEVGAFGQRGEVLRAIAEGRAVSPAAAAPGRAAFCGVGPGDGAVLRAHRGADVVGGGGGPGFVGLHGRSSLKTPDPGKGCTAAPSATRGRAARMRWGEPAPPHPPTPSRTSPTPTPFAPRNRASTTCNIAVRSGSSATAPSTQLDPSPRTPSSHPGRLSSGGWPASRCKKNTCRTGWAPVSGMKTRVR